MARYRTLILMRHAAAGGAARDEDRPLTASGEDAATDAGEWIRANLPPVDAVFCSSAVRTRQTLTALGIDAPADYLDELYNGGIDDILEPVGLLPDSSHTVLVVGHAPGIPASAHLLATQDGAAQTPLVDELNHFSAGALAVLRTEAGWDEFVNQGGELVTVRHPDY